MYKMYVCVATLCLWVYICNIYSTVGRSIANIHDRSAIFTEVRSTEVNMSAEVVYIEAMDRPSVLHIIYCMASVQQANFSRASSCTAICTNGGHYKMGAGSGTTMAGILG